MIARYSPPPLLYVAMILGFVLALGINTCVIRLDEASLFEAPGRPMSFLGVQHQEGKMKSEGYAWEPARHIYDT